jgi:TRAP-type C4-dicarboxylate transport system permease small subunit
MNILRKLLVGFWHAIEMSMAVIMVIMIVLLFINVVLRYGFEGGVLASAEIARFLFVWTIMFGAILCMRDDAHLDLRVLDNKLPLKIRWILRRLVYAVIMLSSGMLCLGSFRQTISNWANISPISGIPVGVMYLAGAFAGAVLVVIAFYRFVSPRLDNVSAEEGVE